MTVQPVIESGAVIDIPLNKLKKSPNNARKTPHGEAAIEALAASIAAKGMLQAPVVAPEREEDGAPTGFWLVTIGEGRRLAMLLRARRKEVGKAEPVRCVVDTTNDAHEISLDENVTRTEMHPADQFEPFRRLAEERGLGAADIGARFGVSEKVVRQRLRLGAVSARLMDLYREGELTLDQLMAFAVSEDHARQEQVYDQLTWNRSASAIRRAMTEAKVPAQDRRAVFVGAEAYSDAGGTILRDLFSEDGGGWFEDVGLLDRLAAEKLEACAADIREREGWKWTSGALDYPHGHGLRRVYPHPVERSEEERARLAALSEEYDALLNQRDAVEEVPPEVEVRFLALDAALAAAEEETAYDPDDIARAGAFVILGHDGTVRVERGFLRAEDEPPAASETVDRQGGGGVAEGGVEAGAEPAAEPEEEGRVLSERLVLELTAYRTQGLRDAVGADPTLALTALVHALALKTFYPPFGQPSCVEVKLVSSYLEGHAPEVADSPAGRRIAQRHETWASRLPRESATLWDYVSGLGGEDLLGLLAHCVGLSINALRNPLDRRPGALAHADRLAAASGLDMTTTWSPTVARYLGRVTKPLILEAVSEAKGTAAAEPIAGLKKTEMAQAAEQLLASTRWLPALLRTPVAAAPIEDSVPSLAAE